MIFADGEGIPERARACAFDNPNVRNALEASKDGAFRPEHERGEGKARWGEKLEPSGVNDDAEPHR